MSNHLSWRQGAAAVVALTFDVDAESPLLARGRRHAANASAMTHQAYGPRVGVPRILALLAEYELPATFFVPGLTADEHPDAVAAILDAGHEIGHHSYAHHAAARQADGEERRDFERGLAALARHGVTPAGHRAAGWEASWKTADLVAEHGLSYDSSLMDDDKPYRLRTPSGTIAELPVHWSLDDWEQYAFLPEPAIGSVIEDPSKVASMWTAEVDAMARHGCLLVLTCHPFLSGRPSRLEALRDVVEHALGRGDIAFASAGEIARRAHADPGLPERTQRPVTPDADIYPNE